MMMSDAQRLKFEVLAAGITVDEECARLLSDANQHRPLTPADYATTSGLILALEDEVWVNAPVAAHNPNFVDRPPFTLRVDGTGMVLEGAGLSSAAAVWAPPDYHGQVASFGRPWNDFVFTHGDRARLAPIGGCAMTCKFCNIPYEDPYLAKPLDQLIAAIRRSLDDPCQPARHLLISGGTPRADDIPYLRDVYRSVLIAFPDLEIDIMMVPVEGLFDLAELRDLGVHELSINIEVHDPDRSRRLMPHKYRQGLAYYLDFIEHASQVLGAGRVRSMMLVGLEDVESTLAGVRSIVNAGGVPVLSPFRPDPSTPLRSHAPMAADETLHVFLEARAIARRAGTDLGPQCAPCTHNTLALIEEPSPRSGQARYEPAMIR